VQLDGKAIFSCLTPIAALRGRRVRTIEGLGTISKPSVLQGAFESEQAAQCGYCTAGMIMRAQELIEAGEPLSNAQIRAHMRTNLCRCGTQLRIIKAVERAIILASAPAAGGIPSP
jgi:aerobic-type carbon monoxide dehydrogenase small subunit (CoxS/CutS family)